MKNINSLRAFNKPENKIKRQSHKEKIKTLFLKDGVMFTTREVQNLTGLNYSSAQKRISDLLNEGFLVYSGNKEEYGNSVSIWSRSTNQLSIIPQKKKSRFEILKDVLKDKLSEEQIKSITEHFNSLLSLKNT